MAQMLFPPASWSQTVTTVDSIQLEYTSSYPNVNLTLYCETVKGSGSWVKWYLPGPLPANGTFNLHLSMFAFAKSINVWPTVCHFDLTNSRNGKQVVNGGNIPLTTKAGAAETTHSRITTVTGSTRTSSVQIIASPTGMSSVTSKAATDTRSVPTAIVTSTPPTFTSLSNNAKIGVGVGVGIGALLLILLAILFVTSYRKHLGRRSRGRGDGNDGIRFEKAELLGTSVSQHRNSENSHEYSTATRYRELAKHSRPGQAEIGGSPQELAATTHLTVDQEYFEEPVRYELAA